MSDADRTQSEALIGFVANTWADIHHSRVQEWSALAAVSATHLALTQVPKITQEMKLGVDDSKLVLALVVIGVLFSVAGALVTCRHRTLMQIKLGWIADAEDLLGLTMRDGNRYGVVPPPARMRQAKSWRGLSMPRMFSTSWLMLCFYVLYVVSDVAAGVAFFVGK